MRAPKSRASSGVDDTQRIGLAARPEIRLFMVAVARELKARHGCSIVLYCSNSQERDFYRTYKNEGLFDDIVIAKQLHTCALEKDVEEEAALALARSTEARIGLPYNFLAVSNRHLGRGFALGGFYHPRSRTSENASYLGLVHAYNETLSFWEREIVERGLTLVLNGPREAALVSRLLGIPYRVLVGSRFGSYHSWAWNEYYETPEFRAAYETGEGIDQADLDRPYHSHLVNRSRFVRNKSALRLSGRAVREVAQYCWWHLRGYEKARGYFLRDNLRMFYRIGRDWRRLNRLATVTLGQLENKPFAYYPLQQEPEVALQGLSPEYFYQLSLIAAVARDLPAGVTLAVKETFGAVGRRPRDFYEQIAEFKNVVMLAPLELGLNCVEKAQAIVTICGTAGFEAAVLGKPVVALGRHNNYNFLPHVRFVERESDLRAHLVAALEEAVTPETRAAGQRFLRAVVARSFDMGEYDFVNFSKFEETSVRDACTALVRGLDESEAATSCGRLAAAD